MGKCVLRTKKLFKNTVSSILYQSTNILCSFVIPKMILKYYGSDVNGLVNSITQFLQVFAFMDLGVGAVFQSALYKPLANNDSYKISVIFKSGQSYFSKLAKILLLYVGTVIILFPVFSDKNFSFSYIATLIIAMSISNFIQYYFGMSSGLLLLADQKGYIQNYIQIITLVINTVVCVILIKLGASIQFVKLTTSSIYILRPIILKIYIDIHYQLDKKVAIDKNSIPQKWSGLAQHIASIVLGSIDTVVLTVFSTFANVSIYSIYSMVVLGIKQIFDSMMVGIQGLIGELYAKGEYHNLTETFNRFEWIIHSLATVIFGISSVLLVPFVLLYTKGIVDANYNRPLFAFCLVVAYAMYCLRLPYHVVIKAAGKYKETQSCYWIAILINISISVLLVYSCGLVGVALGTVIAMLYQTIWMANYNYKNILNSSMNRFYKQLFTDVIVFTIGYFTSLNIRIGDLSIMSWVVAGFKVFVCFFSVSIIINYLLYRKQVKKVLFIKRK